MAILTEGEYLVDTDTGEIVGMAQNQAFIVTNEEEAKWVLKKMRGCHTRLLALKLERQAILRDIEAMERYEQRRLAYLEGRFGPELERWAAGVLEGRKERMVRTPFGRLGFRAAKGRIAVKPDRVEAAVIWCEKNVPGAVSVKKSVLISQVGPDTVVPVDLFDIHPPHPGRFYIDAGVKEGEEAETP